MKVKKFLTVFFIFTVAFVTLLTGCKKKKKSYADDGDYSYSNSSSSYSYSNDSDFYFLPDEEEVVEYDDNGVAFYPITNIGHTFAVKTKDEKAEEKVVISDEEAVKSLSKYKIKYETKKKNLEEEMKKILAAFHNESTHTESKKIKNGLELKVSSWGPGSEIPGRMTKPAFYVVFSAPVHELSALELPMDKSDVFTVTPKVKGTYRWTGTRQLTFEPTEKLDPFTTYTINVNPKLKSVDDVQITGDLTFYTSTDYFRINYVYPGYTPLKKYFYSSEAGIPVEYASDCIVTSNREFTASEFKQVVTVVLEGSKGTKNLDYKVVPVVESHDQKTDAYYTEVKESDIFYLHINSQLEKDATIKIIAYESSSKCRNYESYYTLRPFVCTNSRFEKYERRLIFNFNQPVDLASVKNAVSFDPPINISSVDISVSDTNLVLKNIPMDYDRDYTCYISTKLKDRNGQYLESECSENFRITKPRNSSEAKAEKRYGSYFRYLDRGNRILEAQFPHKFIIEHQNLENVSFSITSESDPLASRNDDFYGNNNSLTLNHLNTRVLDVINLDPYLQRGLGFVTIKTKATVKYYNYWNEEWNSYDASEYVNIQVTDLGVSARAGMDKVCVMVRKLSDNTPVRNATVQVVKNDPYYEDWYEDSNCYGTAMTDKDGFAVVDVSSSYSYYEDASYGQLAVFVKSGDDKVIYPLNNHNENRFSVPVRSMKNAAQCDEFMNFSFTDRQLYRPGETISYRGIVRNLSRNGINNTYAGYKYRVVLEKRSWYDPEEYQSAEGHFSREGGYHGTFDIPKDMAPGEYSISIYYNGEYKGCCPVTIAYFEKLKFQATAEIADVNYVLGDTINADLMASYLGGGGLTGARYNAMWYKKPCTYTPPVPEADNYIFGPDYSYDSESQVNECSGPVNETGATKISCITQSERYGLPYYYKSEIAVTDISNQTIFTGAAKIIHPGNFYIGVAKRLAGGFPEVKTKVEIPFALFKIDGSYATADDVDGDISYSIERSYWTYAYENSVDGIYSRWYHDSEMVVNGGTIKPSTKGNIVFTPSNAGEYTLSVTAIDKKGNVIRTDKKFYVTGNDYWWFDSDNAYALNLSPDKSGYKPGETAKILLQSPLSEGDYLITVERDDIYTSEVRHFNSPCSVIDIPIKEEYLPVVYVSICSYSTRKGPPRHEYGEPDLDKPKGYYGVTAVNIDRSSVAFKTELRATKKVYRPGEEAIIEIKATQDGKPLANAEFTLMVVDRAVLDLVNYHVDDPLEYFYNRNKFPLSCVGGDSRALLMDPVVYKVATLQGGDEGDEEQTKEDERKDFKPTALFEPAIKTDSKGRAIVKFKMPDNLTTYRVTAFGVKENTFTLREAELQVQNPINVMAVQPRKLRIRDTAECGVIATNLSTEDQEVTVTVEIETPKKDSSEDMEKGLKTAAGYAEVDGQPSMKIKVPAGRTKPIYFKIAAMKPGNINLIYHVKSDVLNERLVSPIEIEKSYVYETVATTGVVEGDSYTKNEKLSETEKIILPGWIEDDRGDLQITLDPTQLGALGSSVRYVFDYPYGCLEQQSSRMWPMLIFGDYIDVFGLKSKVDDPKKMIKSWFASVRDEQKSSGGFPYWPGGKYESEFVTIRFAHMYKLALDRGYSKNDIGYDGYKALKFISNSIKNDRRTYYANCYNAYCCYVFSLYNDRSIDFLLDKIYNECINKGKETSLTVLGYCGLAYQNKNDSNSLKRAADIAKIIRSCITPNTRSVSVNYPKIMGNYWYGMYDSHAEALGAILQLFAMQNPHDEMVGKILFTLLQEQKRGYWQSTATTARVFEAIYELIKLRKLDALDFVSTAVIKNGNSSSTIAKGTFRGAGAKPVTSSIAFSEQPLNNIPRNKVVELEFTKNGKGSLYYTTEMRYALPSELHVARNEGLEVNYQITDESGKIITPVAEDSKVIVLETGKTYKIKVSVNSPVSRYYVALRVPIPSGTEIVDTSLSTGASKNTSGDKIQEKNMSIWDDYWFGYWDDWYWDYDPETYDEYYDNAAHYFNNYIPGGNWCKTLTIRATRKGVYPTPPATSELMYEPEVFGRADGYLFIVK